MEKKVYCVFGERCKCIRYVKSPNETDVHAVLRSLTKASDTDAVLKAIMRDKYIILQKPDPDRNNRLYDIDYDTEIMDKDEVTLLFLMQSGESVAKPTPLHGDLREGEFMALNIPVLYEESWENAASEAMSRDIKFEIQNKDNQAANETDPLSQASTSGIAVITQPSPNTHAVKSSSIKNRPSGARSIPYPAALPELTLDLVKILETVSVFEGMRSFIHFWTSHLLSVTNNNPTKQDYQNFSMSIVDTYPILKGGKDGNTSEPKEDFKKRRRRSTKELDSCRKCCTDSIEDITNS
ncbi:uncharacterized protein LOC105840437 isoform X2 [Monomorium pharaonis]|uniref:uncharacterized protein LOC105840437 isoform X2 n=1 Tax=Monomorium pharaonis TaxID=307658 RepID=UPI00063F018E|nr:uncharacterized protein LOC105840437 isoform X2 [Monomorium pharaonis]